MTPVHCINHFYWPFSFLGPAEGKHVKLSAGAHALARGGKKVPLVPEQALPHHVNMILHSTSNDGMQDSEMVTA